MPKPFGGTVNVDIRDSEPDWAPFVPPKAPAGAPNVLYIVLDDVGFSAMSCYGGPIETPNIDRIANAGLRYTQWHTTALCSPTRSCLLTGRNHTRNSMACITEAAIGFPNGSGTVPPENGMVSEILGEQGWNTYMVGKWHLCPTAEMNLASTRRNWPSGRGFERWYGFLGAETNQWYPDLVYDNHPVDQPRSPEEGYHLTDDITDKALEFIRTPRRSCPTNPFSSTTPPVLVMPLTTPPRNG
jgi:arylsulfatase A-like enzyme